MKRALLIFGMHRSGTSALARVVNLLGAELGNDLVPPGPDNPDGFWEHAEAVRINDDLLHGLGRTWYEMRGMPDGWIDSSSARAAAQRIGGLIERDFATARLCVVKDPRMCLVAPVWIAAFEARGFEVECLFIVRDPGEVVASLHRRNQWPSAPLYLMWVQYLMEAVAASGSRRHAMLTYDQLLSDWRGSMIRVAQELHLRWPVTPDGVISEVVDAFVDADQRHHQRPPGEPGGEDPAMPCPAAALYRTCLAIAAGEKPWAAISDLQGSYRGTTRLYAAHVDHLFAERQRAERRAQTAEARLGEQATMATLVRDAAQGLQDKLDSSVRQLQEKLDGSVRQSQEKLDSSVRQLQGEMSALSGEIEARFERQREGMMVVEARIQRQHALLNTISLRMEQAACHRGLERPSAIDAPPRTEMQKLRSALADSDATVAALFASSSWKLTAPLRWLSVHVLRRPPALAVPAAPAAAAPAPRGDQSSQAVYVRRPCADAAAEPGATVTRERRDRRDRRPRSVAFRWM